MKPIRTAYSDAYYCETPQPSMRKLSLVACLVKERRYAKLVKPEPVGRKELELIHHRRYVKNVMTGKGDLADCAFGFWSESYRDGVLAINGGNLLAAKMALEDGIAANVGQGFHHARAEFGAGFCTFNGLALVAALNPDLSVLVIDCDEHAGDGTAELTVKIPNLTNFSICGSRMGCRESERSIVRHVERRDEAAYRRHLREALDFAASTKPALVIYQAGMDPHEDDPLARSQMTGDFLRYRDQFVMETLALELALPFFFVLAGGYQEPMAEKLVPLHLGTFEIAARVKDQIRKKTRQVTNGEKRQPWLILHLPHDSRDIPESVRDQFVLTDAELARELLLMTDTHTGILFEGAFADGHVVRCPVSRLVLDVERFEDDRLEVMSSRGMGAIYTCTSHGHPLRRELSATEKLSLLADFYRPHHKRLTDATARALKQFDKALILDAHSFPSKPQPYHFDQNADRPDICIGTDSFHTPAYLKDAFLSAFSKAGFNVRLNAPYSGALVPATFYQCDPRVSSIMVEVNRRLYMDESTGERLPTFDAAATRIRDCCRNATLSFG